jgi:hypothetical protein
MPSVILKGRRDNPFRHPPSPPPPQQKKEPLYFTVAARKGGAVSSMLCNMLPLEKDTLSEILRCVERGGEGLRTKGYWAATTFEHHYKPGIKPMRSVHITGI